MKLRPGGAITVGEGNILSYRCKERELTDSAPTWSSSYSGYRAAGALLLKLKWLDELLLAPAMGDRVFSLFEFWKISDNRRDGLLDSIFERARDSDGTGYWLARDEDGRDYCWLFGDLFAKSSYNCGGPN
jgi:hypothetical protein